MARPIKRGLDYFPHDVDASGDERIEALTTLYGNDGYGVYFRLLELIYRSSNGELDLSNERIRTVFPRRMHVSKKRFEAILADACGLGLFDSQKFSEQKLLTSSGIQKRFLEVTKMRERWRHSKDRDLPPLSDGKTPEGKPDKENPTKESIVAKESRERETTGTKAPPSIPENLESVKAFFREQQFIDADFEGEKFFTHHAGRQWAGVLDWKEAAKMWNLRTIEHKRNNGASASVVSSGPKSKETYQCECGETVLTTNRSRHESQCSRYSPASGESVAQIWDRMKQDFSLVETGRQTK